MELVLQLKLSGFWTIERRTTNFKATQHTFAGLFYFNFNSFWRDIFTPQKQNVLSFYQLYKDLDQSYTLTTTFEIEMFAKIHSEILLF